MHRKTKRNRTRAGPESAVPRQPVSGARRHRELQRSVVERTRQRLQAFWCDDIPRILHTQTPGATLGASRIYVDVHLFLRQVAMDLRALYPSAVTNVEQVAGELRRELVELGSRGESQAAEADEEGSLPD